MTNAFVPSHVTRAAEGLPRLRFTVAEVEAMVAAGVMKEGERIELIWGELVPMSPKGLGMRASKSLCSAAGIARPPTIAISLRKRSSGFPRTPIWSPMSSSIPAPEA